LGFIDTIAKRQSITDFNSLETLIRELKNINEYPIGIFLPRDQDAVTLICELQSNNINVGKDVLIVGYDDLYLSKYTKPALTTISQPFEKIGQFAIQKLIASIYGSIEKSILVKPELTIRESA
jgi:DNA-binding LacI/PurR family transcriptional regulator